MRDAERYYDTKRINAKRAVPQLIVSSGARARNKAFDVFQSPNTAASLVANWLARLQLCLVV